MNYSEPEKEDLIAKAQEALRQSQKAELRLRFEGKDAEADKIKDANEQLAGQIDVLLGHAIDEWVKNASVDVANLDNSAKAATEAVKGIKGAQDTLERVVKIVGYIDQLVKIIADIAKTFA